jgi:hypothetical protein
VESESTIASQSGRAPHRKICKAKSLPPPRNFPQRPAECREQVQITRLCITFPYYIPVQLNSTILEAPLTLFLGAGASQPLGKPTMAPFVTALATKMDKSGHASLPLFNHLAATCKGDLENILGELDAILNLKSFSGVSTTVSGSYLSSDKSAAWRLRTEIEYEIVKEYSDISASLVAKVYEPFFDLVFSQIDPNRYCLPIFTTNYDTAIEEFCHLNQDYALVDGFIPDGRDYVWDGAAFHSFQLTPQKKNIVLFKLHGSVNWIYVKAKREIFRTQPFHQQADISKYSNVLIYPATHKVATAEPYFTAYDYYGRCCERSQSLLTIGYSFRDYDALARLRSAQSFNAGLTVALVSPDSKKILEGLLIDHHKEVPVELSFGDDQNLAGFSAAISAILSVLTKSS